MLYRDLVQFEPIESVIQLLDADREGAAGQLVETYVVSDRMADQLVNLVLPQLQFLTPSDNKNILIVGNYGTGKSHLLSVLSAVAEYPSLGASLNHPRVREAAQAIAGQFKVVRVEIGSVRRGLRDIIVEELENALADWGIEYTFPSDAKLSNNKKPLIGAVAALQQRYPGMGILLVVDELLDYLRTREERELILDLGFLREVGEASSSCPLRFLGGLQETLFDNPRFGFVAQQLRRVRDRFEQVRISREDIAYVVSHRLLRKTPEQMARIIEHLRQFTPLYGKLADRIEEYAQLFPIHPAYIEVFERVDVAEKREVLKTFSLAIRTLLDKQVPDDQPGTISYDHYWDILRGNPSMRGLPGVIDVVEKSDVLEGRVKAAYTRPHLRDTALRIVHALSVHRLTTSDVNVPLGPTAEELRDDLFLFIRLPEPSAEFLLNQVQVALKEIMRTVSGQYISFNDGNGQYYLDLKKDIDFDAKIKQRGEFMDDGELDRYFFDALAQTLGYETSSAYVSGYRIWLYELPWTEHKVARPGYLFCGAPDERSTAQPPRDFYVYVLPPFHQREWQDEQRADEVIFKLSALDEDFRCLVRQYAGARAMAADSPAHRQTYATKADIHLGTFNTWMRDHFVEHLEVSHQGVLEPARAVFGRLRSTASQNIEELLRIIAAGLLAPEFTDRYPDYPKFSRVSQPITEANRATNAVEAIRSLTRTNRTNLATAILDGLELLDADGNMRPYQSRYAKRYLELLTAKPEGQVVNRGEVIEQVAAGIQPVEKDTCFKLEPEWVAVVLLALVNNGDITLNVDGRETLDAGNVDRAGTRAVDDLTNFRFYSRPRTLPLALWQTIFEGLGLSAGLIRDENTREQAVRELQRVVLAEQQRVATLQGQVQSGLTLWSESVFTDRLTFATQDGMVIGADLPAVSLSQTDFLPHLRGYKQLLEALSPLNTVGKLRNLRLDGGQIADALLDRKAVERLAKLLELVGQLQPLAAYLAEAQANLPAQHIWTQQAAAVRTKALETVRRAGADSTGQAFTPAAGIKTELEQCKQQYVSAYAALHRQLVFGPAADDRRLRLYSDARLSALDTLSGIELMNVAELETWKTAIAAPRVCREFHEGELADTPTCPHCQLRPAQQQEPTNSTLLLDQLESRLDTMLRQWRQALRANLSSETAQHSIQAMTPAERRPVEQFLSQDDDSTEIPQGFVAAATQALHGIEAVTLTAEGLLEALKAGGMPCTEAELKRRFTDFVSAVIRGHDARNTRLALDR